MDVETALDEMTLVNHSRQCNESPICTVDPAELLVDKHFAVAEDDVS